MRLYKNFILAEEDAKTAKAHGRKHPATVIVWPKRIHPGVEQRAATLLHGRSDLLRVFVDENRCQILFLSLSPGHETYARLEIFNFNTGAPQGSIFCQGDDLAALPPLSGRPGRVAMTMRRMM